MKKKKESVVYIDGNNLYKGISYLNWELDYQRLFQWMDDKYGVKNAFIFLGYIKKYKSVYTYLQDCGFHLVFKDTYGTEENKIKGNGDAELILNATRNVFETDINFAILISGDGDFSCLIDFWKEKNIPCRILAPNKKYCSLFLKRKNIPLTFLEEIRSKIEKPPLETEL